LLRNVVDDAVLDDPLEEVELGDGRRESVELDARRTAKRVEELLRVPVEAGLVGHVDREDLAARRRVRDVLRLGVVGHEPLELAERNARGAVLENVV
jgi:hypothetical protein